MADDWTDDELKASVEAYMKMLRLQKSGAPFVKAAVYRDLASQFPRTAKSFERRMMNISSVLSSQGREWIRGLLPLKNVGANIVPRIQDLIDRVDEKNTPSLATNLEAKGNLDQADTQIIPTSAGALRQSRTDDSPKKSERLPVADLENVTPEHIWNAIQKLINGYDEHGFGESTDYDLLSENGIRLAPKAVFGVAACEALGFRVLPIHFTGGDDSASFRILREAGYRIVPKDEAQVESSSVISASDQEWSEGKPKLVAHLMKERKRAASQAKKSQFKRIHGKLFCERCSINPVEVYGTILAESCIEVHHNDVHVIDMTENHITTLISLQCLCANCHRLVHRELREANAEG